jgi:hypothetical protein
VCTAFVLVFSLEFCSNVIFETIVFLQGITTISLFSQKQNTKQENVFVGEGGVCIDVPR